jgi:hypothetical protein
MGGEVGRQFTVVDEVPLTDASALPDPLVGGVDEQVQVVVGDDPAREVAAASEGDRTSGVGLDRLFLPTGSTSHSICATKQRATG